jgi:uncharacterized protein YciI
MLSLICAIAALSGGPILHEQEAMKPTFFVFLVAGKNPPQATAEEVGKYQMAHLDNFKRLFGEGKLLTAGPLGDPAKQKRGIVVLTVPDKGAVKDCFGPDPYVQKGFMDVQALGMKVEFGKINTEAIDPQGIVENRIVVFTAGNLNPDSASVRATRLKHLDHIKQGGTKAGLAFYASLSDSADIRAVALFRGTNDKEILAWLKKDPLVKNGTLKATKMPQWLSKGAL